MDEMQTATGATGRDMLTRAKTRSPKMTRMCFSFFVKRPSNESKAERPRRDEQFLSNPGTTALGDGQPKQEGIFSGERKKSKKT